MVKKIRKDTGLKDYLKAESERLDRQTLEVNWAVFEYTPAYNTGGYYDQDIPEQWVRVSEWFREEANADEWKSQHLPDEGKELRIRRRRLIERTTREWIYC